MTFATSMSLLPTGILKGLLELSLAPLTSLRLQCRGGQPWIGMGILPLGLTIYNLIFFKKKKNRNVLLSFAFGFNFLNR